MSNMSSYSKVTADDVNSNTFVLKELKFECNLRKNELKDWVTSKTFTDETSQHSWYVRFKPLDMYGKIIKCVKFGSDTNRPTPAAHLEVQLCLKERPVNPVHARFSFVLKNISREIKKKAGCFLFTETEYQSPPYSLPLRDIQQNEEFRICVTVHTEVRSTLAPMEEVLQFKNMRHLLSSLQNGYCSDVVIKVDGKEIKCHKSILSFKSPYFSAMFEFELCDGKEKRMEINDFDYETIKAMINFLYVFECPNLTYALSMSLLEASHKYQISDLKDICEKHLISNIDVSNVLHVLLHADTYSAHKVKTEAIDFTWKNSTVFKEAEQHEPLMSRPHLLRELLLGKVNGTDTT